ncbi:MAG: energy transducer TonB [Thiomargarita sp.]|nr:energy transducer TonB [Thiomargarita sp.]
MYFLFKSIKLFSILFIVLSLHVAVGKIIQYAPKKPDFVLNKPITIGLIAMKSNLANTSANKTKKLAKPKKNISKPKKRSKILKKIKKIKKVKKRRKKKQYSKTQKINEQVETTLNNNQPQLKEFTNKIPQQDNNVETGEKDAGINNNIPSSGKIIAPSYKASYLHNSKPKYPRISRRRGEEGKVLLKVKVSKQGTANLVQVKQSSGYQRLDNAAYQAVNRWLFVPAKENGQVVSGWVIIPIIFKLD